MLLDAKSAFEWICAPALGVGCALWACRILWVAGASWRKWKEPAAPTAEDLAFLKSLRIRY